MLVLTRRIGEEVLIDKGQIKIKILGKKNGVIAIGIKAPIHIDVDRKEIFSRKLVTAKFQQKAANEENYK